MQYKNQRELWLASLIFQSYIIFSEIEKSTYFTTAYRFNQDVKDTLSLGKHVIKAFKSDHPAVVEVYSKCDNASSYHGNFYPESLHHICKQNGITLWQLDYNELQKGEDQCNREPAVTRNMIRCFVDEGNDTLTAKDIYKALVNSKMKNTKVSVASFQKNECDKIVNISNYHSTEFTREGMKLWQYCGIGSGNFQSFSKNWSSIRIKSGDSFHQMCR